MSNENERPEIPVAGIIYGDIIYWVTIIGAVVTIIGSVLAFVTTTAYIDPNYIVGAMLDNQNVEQIWAGTTAAVPPAGHWYLDQLGNGTGLMMLGMAIGVFGVFPAIAAAAISLLKQGEKLYGGMAVLAAVITFVSMLPPSVWG